MVDAGVTDYEEARALQETIATRRRTTLNNDVMILNEHPPTITLGRMAVPNHLLATGDELAERGVKVLNTDRGGDITFHGPGQVVGYPIIDLRNSLNGGDVHQYLRNLEEAIIRALESFGLSSGRLAGFTGVWVEPDSASARKIAAMGIKVSHWITQHGFALNANTDLDFFNLIVPCGIANHGVTSIARELGCAVNIQDVHAALCNTMQNTFGYSLVRWMKREDLQELS